MSIGIILHWNVTRNLFNLNYFSLMISVESNTNLSVLFLVVFCLIFNNPSHVMYPIHMNTYDMNFSNILFCGVTILGVCLPGYRNYPKLLWWSIFIFSSAKIDDKNRFSLMPIIRHTPLTNVSYLPVFPCEFSFEFFFFLVLLLLG